MTQYLLEEEISDPMIYDRPYRINFETKDEALFNMIRNIIRIAIIDLEKKEYAKAQSE